MLSTIPHHYKTPSYVYYTVRLLHMQYVCIHVTLFLPHILQYLFCQCNWNEKVPDVPRMKSVNSNSNTPLL